MPQSPLTQIHAQDSEIAPAASPHGKTVVETAVERAPACGKERATALNQDRHDPQPERRQKHQGDKRAPTSFPASSSSRRRERATIVP